MQKSKKSGSKLYLFFVLPGCRGWGHGQGQTTKKSTRNRRTLSQTHIHFIIYSGSVGGFFGSSKKNCRFEESIFNAHMYDTRMMMMMTWLENVKRRGKIVVKKVEMYV